MSDFLAALKDAADRAARDEAAFRQEAASRIAGLERCRSFAFRRLNLLRDIAAAVADAKDEAEAASRADGALCAALGWSGDSPARDAVCEQFAAVAQGIFANRVLASRDEERSAAANGADVLGALAAFEAWYAATHSGPFWALFDQYVSETPVVDF